jgi:hypothetical protein
MLIIGSYETGSGEKTVVHQIMNELPDTEVSQTFIIKSEPQFIF